MRAIILSLALSAVLSSPAHADDWGNGQRFPEPPPAPCQCPGAWYLSPAGQWSWEVDSADPDSSPNQAGWSR